MSRFLNKFASLLEKACQEGVIDTVAAVRLREMAADQERGGGVVSLAAVLGWLGGGVLALGVILLFAANWDQIPDVVKISGFLVLFAAVHGGGIVLRRQDRLIWFAEGLNLLGAILFLAGIGLISQIYQLDGRPPNAVLLWLIATLPLAWAFRSAPLTLLSLAALITWLHMEQVSWGGAYYRLSTASALMIEVGVGVGLIGFAAVLRDREPAIARTFRGVALLLLFFSVYILGFYRHMSGDTHWLAALPSVGALLFGGIGLAIGYPFMLPDNRYLRDRLAILLVLLLAVAGLMLSVDLELVPKGPDLRFFNFGWYRTFFMAEWLLSIAAWVVWFALALWCVFFAARTGRTAYLNAGVLAVGLGVLTRFLDLIGGLFQTGLAFVVGGGILLATCLAVEYWRRKILHHLKHVDQQTSERKT